MKILGLESSGKVASVSIIENSEVIAEFTLNAGITHSQTFLPMIDQVVKLSRIELDEIDFIAVSEGPGSYTGLRIGIATAKGLALGKGKRIIPISTLKALANNIADFEGRIFALIFARAKELYYAEYQAENKKLTEVVSPQVLLLEEAMERMQTLQAQGETIALIGDGYYQFETEFLRELNSEKLFVPVKSGHQLSASSVALLAEQDVDSSVEGSDLKAVYLKKTQAERECGE